MAGSPAGQPRWGARPVRLSAAARTTDSVGSCGEEELAAQAGGQDVRAPCAPGTHPIAAIRLELGLYSI
jgi:hypothetical protein